MARPRKTGARYASGRLRPERPESLPAYWQRERTLLQAEARRAEWGTAIGVLYRADALTSHHMAAAVRFADQRKRADTALSLAPRNPPAQDINRVHGLAGEPDDEETVRKARNAVSAYDAAEEAIGLGSRALAAVQWVVVYDRRPDDYAQLLALREGLTLLAVHYGLVKRGVT